MKKELFKDRVLKEVKTFVGFRYPSGKVRVDEILNNKINNAKEGFGIILEGCGGPIYYFDDLYEQFEKSVSFEDFFTNFIDEINKNLPELHMLDVKSAIDKIDASYILANAVPVLINTAANQELFEQRNLVHKDFPDLGLSVIFQFDFAIGEKQGVIKITKQQLKENGIAEEELYHFSFRNLRRKNPIIVAPLSAAFFGFKLPQAKNITLISANEGLGAVYILCDDIMQKLSEVYEGDLYIYPSSIDEVLVAHSGDEAYLQEMKKVVSEISTNPALTPEKLFLTDRLIKYDKAAHWLSLA